MRRRAFCSAVILTLALCSYSTAAGDDQPLQRGEHVILFPGYAHPVGDNKWELVLQGRVCKGWNPPSFLGSFVKKLTLFMGENLGARYFTLNLLPSPQGARESGHPAPPKNQPRSEDIPVTAKNFKRSDSGHFTIRHPISEARLSAWWEDTGFGYKRVSVGIKESRDPESRNFVYLYPDKGIAIVSDLDDTIKDTHVWSQSAMVVRTFLPFKRVTGMPELYRYWCLRYHARFHYVSGTFDQLSGPMESFLENSGFPPGSIDTRKVNIRDVPVLPGAPPIKPDFRKIPDPCKYKIDRIRPILADFPNTQFCLVGDAGEGDDKAYLQLHARYHNVRWICIRRLPIEHFREKNIALSEKKGPINLNGTQFILFDGKAHKRFDEVPLPARTLKQISDEPQGPPDSLRNIFVR